jgi:arginine/lysine/ornithine decarboxylase
MLLKDKLREVAETNPTRFFMPGHKGKLHPYDITELDLADGTATHDLLEAAERNVANIYSAKYTHFLYGGTTAGILALMHSLQGRVIIGRASHKSLFNGCVLFGIEPIIIDNEYIDGIAQPLSADQIEYALTANPDTEAVFVTTPNYFGQHADLKAIRDVCKNVWLFVDGAHGAHFGLHP